MTSQEIASKDFGRDNYLFWDFLQHFPQKRIQQVLSLIYPNISQNPTKSENSLFFDPDKQIDYEYVDQHTEWPDDTFILDPPLHQKEGNDIIPGIKDVMHEIMKHQFPDTCKNKMFITLTPTSSGLGSLIHIYGALLGIGLDSNRIFVWPPNDVFFTAGPYCGNPPTPKQTKFLSGLYNHSRTNVRNILDYAKDVSHDSFDCFFEKVSNCTFEEAEESGNLLYTLVSDNHIVPEIIKPIIQHLKLDESLSYFYWRLCATAFLYRPNNLSKTWIKEYEEDFLVNPSDSYDVSIHIRHADKSTEMRLVNCDELLAPLNVIRQLLNKTRLNIFLSTENSAVIEYFLKREIDRITYFNFPLFNESLGLDTEMAKVILPQMFVNAKHSLFANFVIGTIGSNWNRLLIELRVARTGFANNYYFEVGDHICLSFQHCKYLNRVFEMNW